MLRVAIVDDHPVARQGVAGILGGVADLELVAVVGHPGELPRGADGRIAADVVVSDLYLVDDLPALGLIAAMARETAVVVISASREPADVTAAVRAGAGAYVMKSAPEEAYLQAVRAVQGGGFFLSSQLADLLVAATGPAAGPAAAPDPPTAPAAAPPRLSPREREALDWIAGGFTHQQTATRMGVSKSTVDTYVERIRAKLQVGNKAELTLAALRHRRSDGTARERG